MWMHGRGRGEWVWTGVDGVADGRWRGSRLGVDRCGRGCGRVWKEMGGARPYVEVWVEDGGGETGCGRVWTAVWVECFVAGMVGEKGVVVGGQRPCTKHVSGLVSNMLRCGLKHSRN